VRFFRWLKTPDGRAFAAVLAWVLTGMNVAWCALDVRQRYDVVVGIQALRMRCEASGGFFGTVGENEAHCLHANDARASERETR